MSSAILHNQAQKQIHQLHIDLQQLESGSDTSSALQGQITATLASVKRAAEDLEEWGKRETSAVKREKALDRAFKLNQDYAALRDRFERHKARVLSSMQAMKDREELLGRRTGTNVKHAEQDTVLLMDQILREHESLNNTNSRLDEYILMGRQALSELVEQRGMLKATQRRMLDIANSLGLSTSVIRFIEQRTTTDRWILFGGLIICILIMWLTVHYFRGNR